MGLAERYFPRIVVDGGNLFLCFVLSHTKRPCSNGKTVQMQRFPRFELPRDFASNPQTLRIDAPPCPLDSLDLLERTNFAIELARLASDVTLGYFQTAAFQVERKSDRSPVTAADKEAEKRIRQAIADRYPDDALLGEEFGAIAGQTPFEWIIDPIDGTKSFISGVPLYSTLVGLTYRSAPLLGAIAIPALGELVVAAHGHGSWYGKSTACEGTPLTRCRVSSVSQLEDGLFLTSQVDNFDRRQAQSAYKSLEEKAYVSRSWGDGYGYLLVATGRAELMVDPIVNPWDIAAVAPVVLEAGGRFSSWSGSLDLRAGHCFASNGILHPVALEILLPFANNGTAR